MTYQIYVQHRVQERTVPCGDYACMIFTYTPQKLVGRADLK
jgi:hypothetical protein